MDENEAGGGDPFLKNEAISAVADDGFLGEEDDDYEDLYNDVNVGENFLQSIRANEDISGERNNEQLQDNKTNLVAPPPIVLPQPPQQPLVESGGVALLDEGGLSRVPDGVEGYQNIGFRGNNNASDPGFGRGAGIPVVGGGGGFRVELGQSSNRVADLEERGMSTVMNNQQMVHHHPPQTANMQNPDNVRNFNGTSGNLYGGDGVGGGGTTGGVGDGVVGGGIGGGGGGGGTYLFVGDLHWWTTDAELESELCKYGPVKEVKFFDERASGKSKGYCQVEFFDPAAASACKEGMNGHVFNGRPCVVAYASPYSVKRMGEAQVNRNQQQTGPPAAANQPRRGPGDMPNKPVGVGNNMASGGNYQGGSDNNGRGFGRGNWGRGNSQGGMGNRGPMGPMRNRGAGGMGLRGLSGNGFGQGIGASPPLMHPQAMMGQGFDLAFGGPMGRMGGYGGYPGGPAAPFPGMLSPFGPVGNVGLPGVAPHVNPAFFGRGMPMNGMGMMPNHGVEGPNMGMWQDPNMGGWAGDEHGGRAGESSYGEEAASEHQYREGSQERGPWPNAPKEKDRGSGRDWSVSPERRYKDDREAGYERDAHREKDAGRDNEWSERRNRDDKDVGRDRHRDRERSIDHERGRERESERYKDDRDRYGDHHRHRNRDAEYDNDGDRGKSSRTHGKSRVSHEEERRSRSRDADYGKRRRVTSD